MVRAHQQAVAGILMAVGVLSAPACASSPTVDDTPADQPAGVTAPAGVVVEPAPQARPESGLAVDAADVAGADAADVAGADAADVAGADAADVAGADAAGVAGADAAGVAGADAAGVAGADAADVAGAEEASPEDAELEAWRKELHRLQTHIDLLSHRKRAELLDLDLQQQELGARSSFRRAALESELADLRAQSERMHAESELRQARRAEAMDAIEVENQRLRDAISRAQLETELSRIESNREVAALNATLELARARQAASAQVTNEIEYRLDPFDPESGTLYVTDRCIELAGPIMPSFEFGAEGTADFITRRLNYYNNKSQELPIFLVISNSPGGSVMEGYRIVKAIQSSPSPVHVVVKSFAASMAAAITTLAEHSYAYPNALILHHQMSYGAHGNMTQHDEQLETSREWERRLAGPIAQKMGTTIEGFTEMMYDRVSTGDWAEFGDVARDLKWVNNLVEEIREQGITTQPSVSGAETVFPVSPVFSSPASPVRVDAHGARYYQLPRLQPLDHWFLYNPDGYYREH